MHTHTHIHEPCLRFPFSLRVFLFLCLSVSSIPLQEFPCPFLIHSCPPPPFKSVFPRFPRPPFPRVFTLCARERRARSFSGTRALRLPLFAPADPFESAQASVALSARRLGTVPSPPGFAPFLPPFPSAVRCHRPFAPLPFRAAFFFHPESAPECSLRRDPFRAILLAGRRPPKWGGDPPEEEGEEKAASSSSLSSRFSPLPPPPPLPAPRADATLFPTPRRVDANDDRKRSVS